MSEGVTPGTWSLDPQPQETRRVSESCGTTEAALLRMPPRSRRPARRAPPALSPPSATADPSKIRGPFSNGHMRGYETLTRRSAAAAPVDNGAGTGMPQFNGV